MAIVDTDPRRTFLPPFISLRHVRRYPALAFASLVLLAVVATALFAPVFGPIDPVITNAEVRNIPPASAGYWFGADHLGRDMWSRTLRGGRISLMVCLSVSVAASFLGLLIGAAAGFSRLLDGIIMRIMDGIMAIPGVLLAIALMTIAGASVFNVIVAIVIPEVPRVVRLARSLVLTIRDQPYVSAAVAAGTSTPMIVVRHVVPNILAPLIVQATYIAASAIIIEAYLSFLGAGVPAELPSWGNIMAEGRVLFQVTPWVVLIPGIFVAVTVMSINMLGDGLRDLLDPHLSRAAR